MYNKQKLAAEALKFAKTKKCIFMQEVIDLTGVSASTFYATFPAFSEESETIKRELCRNRANMKAGLRSKWYASENATVQIALYKLLATPDEFTRLASQKIALQNDIEPQEAKQQQEVRIDYDQISEATHLEMQNALFLVGGVQSLDYSKLSDEALQELADLSNYK